MKSAHNQPAPHRTAAAPATAATLALLADALAWPLLLLRRDGTLLHANLAARQVLRRGLVLRLSAQRQVQPADPARQAEFVSALQRVAAAGGSCLLHWPLPGLPVGSFSARLSALGAADGADRAADSAPLLLALGAMQGHAADSGSYAGQHGLTRAETRVLQRLAQGDTSAVAAAALGLAVATVRSQCVSLRRKTGHASIAALVRTLASLPPVAPGAEGE